MREILVYTIAAIAVITMLGYSVHMFVGGLVEAATERWLIIGISVIGFGVVVAMAMDVIKRRR